MTRNQKKHPQMNLCEKQPELSALETILGYKFADTEILNRALTHSSYANEQKARGSAVSCNERLEFLGDSVLSLVVSEYIFTNYPHMPEGELSRIRAGAVCERALAGYAKSIDLGSYLYIGRGEELTNGRSRTSILADAFEALLAALYLDGGVDKTRSFLIPYITDEIKRIFQSGHTEDFKTMLQQIIQQEQGEMLEYVLTDEKGPAHNRVFRVEARLNNNIIGRGEGKTKREAEQNAAREAVDLFGGLQS
jgi:ribonuclease-3